MTDNEKESEYPSPAGSGSRTMDGYKVSARYCSDTPMELCGQLFDNRWQIVQFDKAPLGVPIADPYSARILGERGLLGYAAAQALRWWFHANAEALRIGGGLCLETKLVKHTISASFECVAMSEHELIGGGDRSNCMPDHRKLP